MIRWPGENWLVAADLDGKAREATIYLAAPVDLADLEQDLAAHIEEREEALWDDKRGGTVVARHVRKLGALILAEKPLQQVAPPELIQQGLLDAVRRKGLDRLPWNEAARQWQARVQLLATQFPPGHWPDVTDSALLAVVESWLAPFMAGMQRWSDLARLDLTSALNSLLDYPQQQELDELAPKALAIPPTGQKVTLDYTADNGPVLAAKLQALFGWTETPTVAGGRVPVVTHLLSPPAQRPLAVTADLASFWQNAIHRYEKNSGGAATRNTPPGRKIRLRPRLSRERKNALLADSSTDQLHRNRLKIEVANGNVLAGRCTELVRRHFFQCDFIVWRRAVLEAVCQHPERFCLGPGQQGQRITARLVEKVAIGQPSVTAAQHQVRLRNEQPPHLASVITVTRTPSSSSSRARVKPRCLGCSGCRLPRSCGPAVPVNGTAPAPGSYGCV